MTKSFAQATALCAVAGLVWAGPAVAGGTKMTGLGDVGYAFNEYDSDTFGSFDSRTLHGAGSAHWSWPNMWNAQGNFRFEGEQFDTSIPVDFALDSYMLGGAAFYRDGLYLVGGELNYQNLDMGIAMNGFNVAGRGEYYWPEATLGGAISYNSFDGDLIEIDGWDLGVYGRYYFTPEWGATVKVAYNMFDPDSALLGDIDGWSLGGEFEYLIMDCNASVYAGVEVNSLEFDITGGELDTFTFGIGGRVYFGTTGSLANRQRTGAVQQLDLNPNLTF